MIFVSVNVDRKVQALNAKTGIVIWENGLDPGFPGVENATRTMVLYGNHLFYPGTDATLYAIDGRNGHVDWKIKFSRCGQDKIDGWLAAMPYWSMPAMLSHAGGGPIS